MEETQCLPPFVVVVGVYCCLKCAGNSMLAPSVVVVGSVICGLHILYLWMSTGMLNYATPISDISLLSMSTATPDSLSLGAICVRVKGEITYSKDPTSHYSSTSTPQQNTNSQQQQQNNTYSDRPDRFKPPKKSPFHHLRQN